MELPSLKHPKSYPLEHFVGECCPDGITSVAEGIVGTLECIAECYPKKPFLPDRGFLSMTYLRCSQMRIMTLSIRRFAAVQDLLEQLMIALI